MKRIAIALVAVFALVLVVGYNVWRANQEPVATPPSEVEMGRQKLHEQLQEAERTEARIEKQDWDSPALLQQVIEAHLQRIDKLKDNSQAGEVVAHDREAIDRLQKRITELREQAAARAAAADEASAAPGAAATDPQPAASSAPAPKPVQPSQNAPPKAPGTGQPAKSASPATHSTGQTTPKPAIPNPAASATTSPDQ